MNEGRKNYTLGEGGERGDTLRNLLLPFDLGNRGTLYAAISWFKTYGEQGAAAGRPCEGPCLVLRSLCRVGKLPGTIGRYPGRAVRWPSSGEALRDWHRLFGLLLTDFFTGSPFAVEVERDLSVQQQLLDVAIVRRGRGRFAGRLPDGLEGLRPHNLMTLQVAPRGAGRLGHEGVESARTSPTASSSAPRRPSCCPRTGSACTRCRPLPAQPVRASALAAGSGGGV